MTRAHRARALGACAAVWWAALCLGACGAPEPADVALHDDAPTFAPLDLRAFAPAAPHFTDEGAPVVACSAGGVIVEDDGALEVRTGLCDPADLALTLPDTIDARAIGASARLRGTLTHDALVADGGTGHVALLVDGVVTWELELALPRGAAYHVIDAPLPADVRAGAVLGLHVHNHGANAWRVHDLALVAVPGP